MGGGDDNDYNRQSQQYASITPEKEADSSVKSQTSESESESKSLVKDEILALADQCQKLDICSGLEKTSFGGWDYLASSANKHRVIFVLGGPGTFLFYLLVFTV